MRSLIAALLCLLPLAALGQTDDRGWLTGRIETLLSDAGREVRIEGFAGALSSRATFDRLTIADEQGVWLTIRGGAMQWDRAALLSRVVRIEELSAEVIEIPRLPEPGPDLPRAEARPFALPDLPVSIRVGRIAAETVTLGAPVLGAPVSLALDGALDLAGGSGATRLTARRLDAGAEGQVRLDAGYEAGPRRVKLDLLVAEGPGGIVAGLLGLPGAPSLTLAAAGVGPVDDLTTDIALSTGGQRRLKGQVRLLAEDGTRRFAADLSGDVTPLLAPDYRGFFGPSATLVAEGARQPSGRLDLSRLSLSTARMTLAGALSLGSGGMPEAFDLTLELGAADGPPTRLPVPGAPVRVQSATARLGYDARAGEGWSLVAEMRGLDHPALAMDRLDLAGSGRISPAGRPIAGGRVRATGTGLGWADPALAAALGPEIEGAATFHWQQGAPLSLSELRLAARDLSLAGRARAEGPIEDLTVTGAVTAGARDLSRFALLADRPLAGALEGRVTGRFGPLTGAFDAEARLDGTDLALGDARLDRALAGASQIVLSMARDTGGTDLRQLAVAAGPLSVRAAGRVATGAADVVAEARLTDLARLDPAWRGAAEAVAFWRVTGADARLTVEAKAEGLALGRSDLDRFVAGDSRLAVSATGAPDDLWLEAATLESPLLAARIEGGRSGDGARRAEGEVRLADLSRLVPGYPGPVTLTGSAAEAEERFAIDLAATGPGGLSADVAGLLDRDLARADLAITGRAEAALANPLLDPQSVAGPVGFDLRLAGKPGLAALSGTLRLSGGRLSAPAANLALEGLSATARLANGRVALDAAAAVVGGGRVAADGSLGLGAGQPADLALTLSNVAVTEPDLFRARLDGALRLAGPLAGGARLDGALTIAEAELRIPETLPGGAGLLPGLAHRGATAPVRATQARAGLLGADAGNGAGPALALDVLLEAPRRIFVRGRGLDAELGGSLRLGGTTRDVTAAGGFDLVRGRLDLLGRRFTLDRGQIGLQGPLDPFLRFAATAEGGDVTATITIEGPASAPVIGFSSVPDLPQEEIVARLLFGKELTSLSPLQAAQLAGAVATLAGAGGEGIVGRIRRGFGLDDLDIATGSGGTTELRLGKYLSENLYSDVTIGSDGQSSINLNLDVRPGVTVRGSVGSDGQSGIGLFYQRDF